MTVESKYKKPADENITAEHEHMHHNHMQHMLLMVLISVVINFTSRGDEKNSKEMKYAKT